MTPSVFISHASSDRKVADAICTALEARGFDCWIAFRDVGPGQNFGEAITQAIRAVRVMVLVFSSHANNSDEIKKEVVLAGRAKVPVIPLRVEEIEPTGAFEYELVTRQWIDLFVDWDRAVDGLARQVRTALEAAAPAAPAVPVAEVAVPPPPPAVPPPVVPPVAAAPMPVASAVAAQAQPGSMKRWIGIGAAGVVGIALVLGWVMRDRLAPAPHTTPVVVTAAAVAPPVPAAVAVAPAPAVVAPAPAVPAVPVVPTAPPAVVATPAPAPVAVPAPAQAIAPDKAAAEAYRRGVGAFERKDYAGAMQAAREAADRKHPQACLLLAWIYFKGYGVPQDYAEAMRWYRAATERGVVEAPNEVGWLYLNGLGVPRDEAEAMRWFRKGAEMGDTVAQVNIGAMYRDGTGVAPDPAEALRWFRKVAEIGTQPEAQSMIGFLYQNGAGVPQDYKEAMRWYRAAVELWEASGWFGDAGKANATAEQNADASTLWFKRANEDGFLDVQVLIGGLYENGLGVTKDYAEALRWYRRAAERDFAPAQYALGLMYEGGLGVQRSFSQAREWMKKAAAGGNDAAKQWLGGR